MTKGAPRHSAPASPADDFRPGRAELIRLQRMDEREQHLRAEEERIRKLTRELHEAAKDARAAASELDGRMKRWGGSATAHYRRVIAEREALLIAEMETYSAIVRKLSEETVTEFAENRKEYREHIAHLLGAHNAIELREVLTASIASSILPTVERAAAKAASLKAFRKIVIEEVAKGLEKSLDEEDGEGERKAILSLISNLDSASLNRLPRLKGRLADITIDIITTEPK